MATLKELHERLGEYLDANPEYADAEARFELETEPQDAFVEGGTLLEFGSKKADKPDIRYFFTGEAVVLVGSAHEDDCTQASDF